MARRSCNPTAESLYDSYSPGRPRRETYEEMVERMLAPARAGLRVCVAMYGHPGVFVLPAHEAIRRARAEGIEAVMLPGVSAEDCLVADVGFDPGARGCQSFEATDFLIRHRRFDPSCAVLLWQIGGIGVADFRSEAYWNPRGVELLARSLAATYGRDHEVVVYEASPYPVVDPLIHRCPIAELACGADHDRLDSARPAPARPRDRSGAARRVDGDFLARGFEVVAQAFDQGRDAVVHRQEAGVEDVDGFLRSTAVAEKVGRSVLVPPDQQGWNRRRAELRHDSGELRPLRPSSRHEDDAELELGRRLCRGGERRGAEIRRNGVVTRGVQSRGDTGTEVPVCGGATDENRWHDSLHRTLTDPEPGRSRSCIVATAAANMPSAARPQATTGSGEETRSRFSKVSAWRYLVASGAVSARVTKRS